MHWELESGVRWGVGGRGIPSVWTRRKEKGRNAPKGKYMTNSNLPVKTE